MEERVLVTGGSKQGHLKLCGGEIVEMLRFSSS